MKASESYLTKLLSHPSQFQIPLWQREYAWTEEDYERLFEDIRSVGRRRREAVHFIDSIITLSDAGAPAGDISVFRVVDGQQRLITTNLLLLAIAELLDGEPDAAQTWTATKIRQQMTGNGRIGNAYRCSSRYVRRVLAEDGSIEPLVDGLRRVICAKERTECPPMTRSSAKAGTARATGAAPPR